MKRSEILDTAKRVVCADRKDMHGRAEDSFCGIAHLWAAYLDMDISPVDVAAMMILLKIARAKENPMHMDNFVDMCGYAACGGEIAEEIWGTEGLDV